MRVEKLSRREILILGKNLFLTSLVAGVPAACSSRRTISTSGWDDASQPINGKGVATVRFLSGTASVNAEPVSAGDRVSSGAVLELATGGRMVLALPDRSVLQLKDDTQLKLDLDSEQGGDLTLKHGSLLSVVTSRPRSRYYRIRGAAALIGVKGTVCFLQVFKPDAPRSPDIPLRATDYFCICNGAIDYLNPASSRTVMSDSAEHHDPYFLYPDGSEIGFIDTDQLLNHDDKEILSLINRMEGQKHETRWLQKYGSGYHSKS
ncbi:MAG: FecR domain-containing protein [bacterium]